MNSEDYSWYMQSEIHSALPATVAEKQFGVSFPSPAFPTKFNWDSQIINICLYITKHVFFMVYFKCRNNHENKLKVLSHCIKN
jgi:hypothetical protein